VARGRGETAVSYEGIVAPEMSIWLTVSGVDPLTIAEAG
jgi:hypothetical protein